MTTYAPDIPGTGSTPNLPPKPAGESYTADAPWLTACNGMVLSFNSGGATPAECGTSGWAYVRQLAQALGQVDGMTQAQARQNLAVAAFTQANPGANLTQFRTSVEVPFSAPSTRFVTFSVDAAAVSCFAAHPAFQFAIFTGAGAPIPVGSTLNPCAAGTPTRPVEAIGGNGVDNINAARFTTNQSYPFTGTSLGVLMRNTQGSGSGNDAAFDNIRVYDATPQLDKTFTPAVVAVGDTSMLTLTVTNTDERAAKSGFSFTDSLPAGLTIAATPAPGNSCGGTLTAAAGGSSVTLTGGSLAAGAASCTVAVPVTAAALGLYANGPANITSSIGLNPPANATLAVLSTVGTGCRKVPIYTNTGEDPLMLQAWDPTDGTELGSAPLSESYGDIALTGDGSLLYGVRFTQNLPEGRTIDRVNPVTGAVISSFQITGDMATDDVAAINGLSVRADGMLLAGSYLSSNIYLVNPTTGASTRFGAGFPTDVVSAGDFVTLPDGDILALGAQLDGSVAVYRIPPDLAIFQVGTVGSTFGAAMSGGDLYLIGSAGELYRVESIPTTASTDVLPSTLVVNTALPFYGATSTQDAGDSVCNPAVLTLQKTWVGARVGDAVSMQASIDGNLIDSMDSVVASSNQTTTDTTPITVYDGDVIDFAETFTAGTAAGYGSALTCTGNAHPLVGDTLTVGATDSSIVCTYTNTGLSADLAISKTDGSATYVAGSPITYTIVASNAGPADAIGASVVDTIPASIVNPTWTCTGAGGASCPASGAGSIGASVNIPVGGTATFVVTGTISASASGDLVNTATIAVPGGMTDPAPGNNSATDTDTAAGSPFVCDVSTIFVGQGSPTQLNAAVYGAGGAATFNPIGPASDWIYNAVAYRDADRFIYAITQARNAANPVGHLLRIDPTTGLTVDLGTITGPLATSGANIGAFDSSDNYWIAISAGTAIYRLDLTTHVATPVNLVPSQAINVSDFTYADGFLWGVTNSAQTLVRIDPATGNTSQFPIPFIPAGTYGAIWTFGNGNLGLSNNVSGVIYQIAVTNPSGTPTLTLVSSSPGPSSSNNDGTSCVAPPVDLGIVKTGPATVAPGGALSWNLVVTNHGPGTSSGFTVSDVVPAGVTGVASPTPGCTVAGNTVTCVGGTLASGGTFAITITGNAPNPFTAAVTNSATVTGNEQDPNSANDTSSATVAPQPPQLVVTKTATPNPFVVGQPGSYAITVQNAGTGPTTAPIAIADTLPSGVTFAGAAGTGWSCTGAPTLSCTFAGTLAAGASTTLTINVTVDAGATNADNSATASGGGDPACPAAARCTGTVVVPVSSIADLAITKTDGSAIYTPGNPITYTIVASNAGPSTAVGATVADTIPAAITGATWTAVYSAGASGPASGSGNINATVTIPAGGTATFTVTGTVGAGTTGSLSNTATVTAPSGTTDPVPGNNSATDTDAQGPQLTVTKSATPNPFLVGQPASYAITVTNSGGTPTSAPITIADTLPAGITLATFGGANWTCTGTTALSCTFGGTLAAGASTTLTLDVDVAASAANGDNTATASGGGDPGCPAATRCVGTVVVPVTRVADIALLKTVDNAAPNVGEQVTFTITATNHGPNDATGVAITDGLPFGLSLVSATPSVGTFDPASGLWTIGNLANGASQTLTLTVSVDVAGALTNHAVVSASDQPDPDTSNNSAAAAVNAEPSADIGVLKTVDDTVPNVGSDVTYTLTATNHGPSDATGVEITDHLPAGVSFVSAAPSQGSYDGASGVWVVGALADGASATLTITVHVDQAGSISNTATVTHEDQFDPNPTNNSSGTTINGQSADLAVTKTVDDAAPTVGDDVVFTITIHNNGPSDATSVVLTDQLPATLSFVSATPSQGSYAPATGLWSVGTLTAAGPTSTATLTITATVVDAGATTNTATVTGADQPDPNPANNSDSASLNGNPLADLRVTKSGSATVTPGDDVVYTIVVTNQGPSDAANVVVADATPAGLVFVSNAGACTTAYPCSIGTLANGASATITTTYSVPANYSGANPIVNTAIVSSDTPDPDPTNNQGSAQTGVGPGNADLAITKTGPAAIASGGAISYTLLIVNHGPSPANGASYSDVVPAGITGITATCAGEQGGAACVTPPTVTGNTVTGTVGTLPSSGSVLVTINGTAPQGPLTLSNMATVTPPSGVNDPDPSNNQDDVDTAVGTPMADLVVEKTGPAGATPGTQVTYTLTVTNNGPDDAVDATLDDPTPPGLSFVSATPPCAAGFPCDLGTLADGASAIVTVTFAVDAGATGDLVNTATAGSDTPDPDPSNNEDSVTIPVTPQANLAAVKTGPAIVGTGGAIGYTVVVTNAGPGNADGALFSDPVPVGVTAVAASCGSPTGGAVCGAVGVAGNTVTSTITALPAGGSVTFTIGGTAPANATRLTNTAGVEPPSGTVDPDPSDNQDSVDTDVVETPTAADLVVAKTGPAGVAAGSDAVYTIVVTNHGPDPAVNVVVADPTPNGLVFVSNAGACATAYPCAIGTLASGASATITTTYAVPAAYAGPNPIANTASASSDTPDPNASNNSDTAITPLAGTPAADLVVTKTGPASATAGQTISYSIQVANHGPDAVPDAVLDDPTPAGLEYVSSTAPCAGGFPCALPPLANGASVTFTVTYVVQQGYSGTISNVADAQSPTVPDPEPENNTSTVSTPVTGNPPASVRPVPVDARWMLMLMGVLLMLAGVPALRRRR
ncbi:CARDB domain-containing protein [Dokdonella sp.]|uniref:DUF6923 family protein n=1 Tax=Dokdonella sp. TaxID=2291710 RepID=UPI001B2044C6|nr:CARDB domain-containing protein [Dokdonella sp.]MBO9664651.1 DUF11 domain-containing protein [Dokdonella sp.]